MIRWLALGAALWACGPSDTPPPPQDTAQPDTAPTPRPALPLLTLAQNDADAPGQLTTTLRAAPSEAHETPLVGSTYSYNAQLLRAQVGDVLAATLVNDLDTPTTIHWHGAGAPYEMDGVPWQREPTAPGASFLYTFPLERSGTFWFHPHFDTERQVDQGLYGVLVVADPEDPPVAADLALVFDAPGEAQDDPHNHAPEGSQLQWTTNGALDPVHPVPEGDVRLRLLNASNTGYLALDTSAFTLLATDQGRTQSPYTEPVVVLGPGDRAELLVRVTGDVHLQRLPYTLHGGPAYGAPQRVLSLLATEPAGLPSGDWSLPPVSPTPDPGRTDVSYTFQGDGETWRINHEVFPDVTIAEVQQGDAVVVEVRNLSATHHPFHGHGHAFEVLSVNGVPPARYTLEDTFDVPLHSTVRLLFHAQRVGDWMQHCHILPHADGGMMTVLRVTPESP